MNVLRSTRSQTLTECCFQDDLWDKHDEKLSGHSWRSSLGRTDGSMNNVCIEELLIKFNEPAIYCVIVICRASRSESGINDSISITRLLIVRRWTVGGQFSHCYGGLEASHSRCPETQLLDMTGSQSFEMSAGRQFRMPASHPIILSCMLISAACRRRIKIEDAPQIAS